MRTSEALRMRHGVRSMLPPEGEPTSMAAGCVRRWVAQLSLDVDARAIGSKSNRMGEAKLWLQCPSCCHTQRCGLMITRNVGRVSTTAAVMVEHGGYPAPPTTSRGTPPVAPGRTANPSGTGTLSGSAAATRTVRCHGIDREIETLARRRR